MVASRRFPNSLIINDVGVGGYAEKEIRISAIRRVKMEYKEYLKTDHWNNLRIEAYSCYDKKCQICDSTVRLNVHHLKYGNWFKTTVSNLRVVCEACHYDIHKNYSHFRENQEKLFKIISIEIIRKIRARDEKFRQDTLSNFLERKKKFKPARRTNLNEEILHLRYLRQTNFPLYLKEKQKFSLLYREALANRA